jgi:hypothetical protein
MPPLNIDQVNFTAAQTLLVRQVPTTEITRPDAGGPLPQPVTLPQPPALRAADVLPRSPRTMAAALQKARRLRATRERRAR